MTFIRQPLITLPTRLSATLATLVLLLALGACQSVPHGKLTPAQVGILKHEGFALTDNGWELGMPDKLLFGLNEDAINGDQVQALQRLGTTLHAAGIDRARVDGHTDDSGSAEYNQQLSVRRAQAVARILAGAGFAPENIEVRGLGKSRPVADNRTATGRSENRRVAIIVTVD